MDFFQDPPRLGNQYDGDLLLRSWLERTLPDPVRRAIEPELREMGELAATTLFELSMRARRDEPELVPYDPWGRRVDEIRVPEAWRAFAEVAAEFGLVAIPHERAQGAFSRIHQGALVHLFGPSSSIYTCPLAMSDGAVTTLVAHENAALVERAVPRLTSRDPARAWTSGQWMTERTGGSDVGQSLTRAVRDGDRWRLHGTKWFTSATTSEMTLTLARPEGNPGGGKGLALFYLELRGADGAPNGLRVLRLKDKLGTRMLPTAEVELDGAVAIPVAGLSDGVRAIAPMLQITRTWNALCAVCSMRRGVALARDYAGRRSAFGGRLADKPLHVQTLAELEAEYQAAFLLTFRLLELLGRVEAGEATDWERRLVRILQPIAKLLTGKQSVAHASEVLEAFGGAGYIEDTGLPALLRDAQVLPIWEGTTNVLSLDLLRALSGEAGLFDVDGELSRALFAATDPALIPVRDRARALLDAAGGWFSVANQGSPAETEGGARRFAMAVGRSLQLALVAEHAQWLLGRGDRSGIAVARQLVALSPVPDVVGALATDEARLAARPGS
ncbi:MAG TPA: acyl-CoA dehydrogenase family protein [Myxococcaceae bacterium]|jgi:alkylation response protein AidB-like acyl-CoA dehydrogenase